MSTIAGDLVTTTASTATSIHYAGQSQLIADGKLDTAETGQRIVVVIFFMLALRTLTQVTQFGPRKPCFPRGIFKSACKSRDYISLFSRLG